MEHDPCLVIHFFVIHHTIGATNIPWSLDSAIRRRFEKKIYIPLPDARARTTMFKLHLGKTPNTITEADFNELGKESHMRSGADIKTLVKDAIMAPVRKLQAATHFTECTAPDRDNPEQERKVRPCSPLCILARFSLCVLLSGFFTHLSIFV